MLACIAWISQFLFLPPCKDTLFSKEGTADELSTGNRASWLDGITSIRIEMSSNDMAQFGALPSLPLHGNSTSSQANNLLLRCLPEDAQPASPRLAGAW